MGWSDYPAGVKVEKRLGSVNELRELSSYLRLEACLCLRMWDFSTSLSVLEGLVEEKRCTFLDSRGCTGLLAGLGNQLLRTGRRPLQLCPVSFFAVQTGRPILGRFPDLGGPGYHFVTSASSLIQTSGPILAIWLIGRTRRR